MFIRRVITGIPIMTIMRPFSRSSLGGLPAEWILEDRDPDGSRPAPARASPTALRPVPCPRNRDTGGARAQPGLVEDVGAPAPPELGPGLGKADHDGSAVSSPTSHGTVERTQSGSSGSAGRSGSKGASWRRSNLPSASAA